MLRPPPPCVRQLRDVLIASLPFLVRCVRSISQMPDLRVKAHFIERELLMTPWNVTKNFVLAS